MGQAQSTVTQASVSTAVTQTVITSLQNCGGSASSTQSLNVTGTGNTVSGITMNQTATLNFSCLSNSQQLATLQNQIANTISSQLSQSSVGDTTGGAATTNTAIQNEVANNFTASNIQNCFANLSQAQSVNVSGSGNAVSDVDMTATMNATISCVGSQIANMSATTSAINSAAAVSSNTTSSPLDFIGNLFSGLTEPVELGIGAFIFVIVLIIIVMVVMGMRKSTPTPGFPPGMPFAAMGMPGMMAQQMMGPQASPYGPPPQYPPY